MDKLILYSKEYFDTLIKDSHCYYAHLPKKVGRLPELLSEHSSLTFAYASNIIVHQSLEKSVAKLIDLSIPLSISDKQSVTKEIRRLFNEAIAFHDLGKLNYKFQHYVMKNDRCKSLNSCLHQFGSQHSVLSMYLYLAMSLYRILKREDEEVQMFLYGIAVYFSYNIVQHHASMLLEAQNEIVWSDERLQELSPYLSLLVGYDFTEEFVKQFHFILQHTSGRVDGVFYQMNNSIMHTTEPFSLYALMRLHYSILTSSDYLATAHYINGWKNIITDFGLITNDLRERIIHNASTYKYNKAIYESIERNDFPDLSELTEKSNTNLNLLRRSIATEVITNVRRNRDKNLFYIEAPTGGGKTNVSMLAVAELLKDKTLNKIFYVFPFTTLITQTYVSLKDVFGLENDEIIELHSKAAHISVSASSHSLIKEETDDYKNEYIDYIDSLFVNYPVSLLSHVRFFEYLTTNKKEANYVFSRLANSVVILDEIQSYNPSTWDVIAFFIKEYSTCFNMKFIVMSATLPKIGEIVKGADFTYLIENKNKYFLNPNFCRRVVFDYSLLDWNMPCSPNQHCEYLGKLHDKLLQESRWYAENNNLYPDSVHVIIEFIYKHSASEFYALFSEDTFFDEIYLLSGTILEPRRKEIIENLKTSEYRKMRVLLISTQVVEAGVDIDMDLGFKDKSIIDSEEQLAGRINRNVRKQSCKLYVFNCDAPDCIYGKDERFRVIKSLSLNKYMHILEQKDFDYLYKDVLSKIIRRNSSVFFENINDLKEELSVLNYKKVDRSLILIDTDTVSVFVPLSVRISCMQGFISLLDELDIYYDEWISGVCVWNAYVSLLLNQDFDFVEFKRKLVNMRVLMSYFTFSLYITSKDFDLLKTYGEERYGYFYLENYHAVYSLEGGININICMDSLFI